MKTVAYYSKIRLQIEKAIFDSKEEIKIAVAWLNSKELLTALTDRASKGVKIQLILSDDKLNADTSFKKFIGCGGQVSVLNSNKNSRFLHEKFSIFDSSYLILGSYNWTNGAEYSNHESIIKTDDQSLINQYNIRFKFLLNEATRELDFAATGTPGAFEKESEFTENEIALEEEILHAMETVKDFDVKISKHTVLSLIENYGAIGACRKVLEKGNEDNQIPKGFYKLAEAKMLNWTFEYIMLKDKYKMLFDEDIKRKAKERLDKFSK